MILYIENINSGPAYTLVDSNKNTSETNEKREKTHCKSLFFT